MIPIAVTVVILGSCLATMFHIFEIIELHFFNLFLCVSRIVSIIIWIFMLKEFIKFYDYQGEIKVSIASLMTTNGTDKLLILLAYTIIDFYVL